MDKYMIFNRKIYVTQINGGNATSPLVIICGFDDDAESFLGAAEKAISAPCSLALVGITDWQNDLSPWKAEPIFKKGEAFGDGAGEFLTVLTENIIPELKATLSLTPDKTYIAGYSLAGLFALYALRNSDQFHGAVSASGSLWFPGFAEYFFEKEISSERKVYLSLGDKESHTKNPVMSKVEENTQKVYEHLVANGNKCVFEMNPGGHFNEAGKRLLKGIMWITDAN